MIVPRARIRIDSTPEGRRARCSACARTWWINPEAPPPLKCPHCEPPRPRADLARWAGTSATLATGAAWGASGLTAGPWWGFLVIAVAFGAAGQIWARRRLRELGR